MYFGNIYIILLFETIGIVIWEKYILYTTTTTQRGWCVEAFVSSTVQSQPQTSLPGGGGVQNIFPQNKNTMIEYTIRYCCRIYYTIMLYDIL